MAEQIQTDIDSMLIELVNRMRSIEGRHELIAEKLLVVNQNMVNEHKRLAQEIKGIKAELNLLKNDLNELKNIMRHLAEDASMFARKEEVRRLEKYINMWNPLKFVTESDVKKIVLSMKSEEKREAKAVKK
ncbi:hypothetical protein HZB88_01595 [archaeon]|nr:hypothetical protein [archaeon]